MASSSLTPNSAQLKVNLRPLWTPAAAALSTLSNRFGDLVWTLLFQELQDTSSPAVGKVADPAWAKDCADDGDDIWEEERSWRDPSAHKVRTVLSKWLQHSSAKRSIIQVRFLSPII